MPTAPPASPAKPKTKQSHVRSIVQQILKEPFEIAKTAGNQITGGELQDIPQVNGGAFPKLQGNFSKFFYILYDGILGSGK